MENLLLKILSPQGVLFEGEVTMVIAKAPEGDFGVLAHHAPMILQLTAGKIRAYQNSQVIYDVDIEQGWSEISNNSCCLLVTEPKKIASQDLVVSKEQK